MKVRKAILAAMLPLVASFGCSPAPKQAASPVVAVSAPALQFNEDEFRRLAARVDTLERDANFQKFMRNSDEMASLKPDEKTWQQVKTSIGYVVVSLDNVSEYANGSEIVLQFGNPLSATISQLSATVEWGRVDEKGNPVGEAQTKDVTFTDVLPAASWHKFKVTLASIPPKELGYVNVKNVQFRSSSLRNTY